MDARLVNHSLPSLVPSFSFLLPSLPPSLPFFFPVLEVPQARRRCPCAAFPPPFYPSLPPSPSPSLQVRAIVLENMGDDAKVQDYLKANGDDKAEFAAMGFDSLDLVEFSMAIQKVWGEPVLLPSLPPSLPPCHPWYHRVLLVEPVTLTSISIPSTSRTIR